MRDLARRDEALDALDPADRALAFRLAMGVASAAPQLDELIDAQVRRPSSLEPRVRDALRVAAYELCHLDTPAAVAASQGVELVRAASPRAVGLANAVLRRLSSEVAPRVEAARTHMAAGTAGTGELSLASGLPSWLVERLAAERGPSFATSLCAAQGEPAPVFVALNGLRHDRAGGEALLSQAGLHPDPVAGLPGSYRLGEVAPLARSGLVERVDVVVSDCSAQLVCRLAVPAKPCALLEVGQGRGTKSVLLASALGASHPTRIEAVELMPYKVGIARQRMARAGLARQVRCHELDACRLDEAGLPEPLADSFDAVLVDAPCSGTGTMRRHPEIPAALTPEGLRQLAALQLRMLEAAAARVAPGGVLCYATCSVLREEDEAVVEAFLASDAGRRFSIEPVVQAPACEGNGALSSLATSSQTPEGYLLTMPAPGSGDGHFCARLVRTAS